ncbi:MAG: exosortase [Verrucomicrobiales bacterium]|nr:exosortase [Verrucomicrobiales bacterium]
MLKSPTTRFLVFAGLVTLVFGSAWKSLFEASLGDELYSYTAIIPVVVGWLIWQTRNDPVPPDCRPTRSAPIAMLLGLLGIITAGGAYWARSAGAIEAASSLLAGPLAGWVLLMWSGVFWFFGTRVASHYAFPMAFLAFTIPLPEPLVNLIETGLQHGSAALVEGVFRICRITYYRDERMFWLDGLRFEVAQECSGIRSTLVLFITSLLAGYLLLKSTAHRLLFSIAIVPLGLLRNTLRICTITLLSVYVDPGIIHSPLHHRGGPLFFAVSLVPLFAMLWWFRRQERRKATASRP